MLCALLLGVIPALRNESPHSRALHAWLDIWIPLILALPVVALPFLAGSSHLSQPATLSLMVTLPVSAAGLIVGLALVDPRNRPVSFVPWHHLAALLAVAAALTLASITGRLSDWSGHVLLTAAILWLWTVSSEPSPAARAANADGDPVFLVDWTGPLARPVGAPASAALAVGPLVLLAAAAAPYLSSLDSRAPLNAELRFLWLPASAGAVTQMAVLAALWWRVSPAAAIRCGVSTVILIVLLATGVLCVRLIPWLTIIAGFRQGVEASYEVRDLTRLDALSVPAALVLGLSLVGLSRWCSRRSLAAMGLALAAAAFLSLSLSIAGVRAAWPAADAAAAPAGEEEEQEEPGAGGGAPQSDAGTFLQDRGI